MTPQEAYEILYQLSRATPVVGDVGDKREEALAIIKKLIDKDE